MIVFTLHRYIFKDLIKAFVLTTIAMTLIFSLGSILRPVQEHGAGPIQAMMLLWYFVPITLTFVMPIAALFSCTIVYGRFAADNELDACRASGIGITTLIYPGLCLAVTVAIINLMLSFHVVPSFVDKAEKSINSNIKQILYRNLERKGYYSVPESRNPVQLHADAAKIDGNTLKLLGVNIIKTKDGIFNGLITAKAADITFDISDQGRSQITIEPQDAFNIDINGQSSVRSAPIIKEIPPLLEENVKFLKINKLKQIKNDPMLFKPINDIVTQTHTQLSLELMAEAISNQIADSEDIYYVLESDNKIIKFTSKTSELQRVKNQKDESEIILRDNVIVYEFEKLTGLQIRTWNCDLATISLQSDYNNKFKLSLERAYYYIEGHKGQNPILIYNITDLNLPEAISSRVNSSDMLSTIKNKKCQPENISPKLAGLMGGIKSLINKTYNAITAEIHFRLVFGIGCISIITVGICLGIIHRGGHILSAFGLSVMPAAALLVFLMMGKNLTKNPASPPEPGLILMWLGFLLLSTLAVFLFRKLTRN